MSKIVIIGSGVVGQATGKGFIQAGHSVTFVDINPLIIEKLTKEGYQVENIHHINNIVWDVCIICLPTPLKNGAIDLSFFDNVMPHIGAQLAKSNSYQLIVVRSTIPPCTTEHFIIPSLEKYSKKRAGKDFGVCMNPEFLRQKTSEKDFLKPWSIVIGALDKRSGDALLELYRYFIQNEKPAITITDLRTAEIIKYVQNLYNATKISFSNEIWTVCNKLEIDGDIVMSSVAQSAEGMWNAKYGTRCGYPFDGHCLPKDTRGFLAFAERELKVNMPLLEAVITVNNSIEANNKTGAKLE